MGKRFVFDGVCGVQSLAAQFPGSNWVTSAAATAQYNLRNFDEAQELFEDLLERDPNRVEVRVTTSKALSLGIQEAVGLRRTHSKACGRAAPRGQERESLQAAACLQSMTKKPSFHAFFEIPKRKFLRSTCKPECGVAVALTPAWSSRKQSLGHCAQGMDIYSNILYVKEAFAALSHLAHRVSMADKYRPESCCIIGNYYSLKGQHEKVACLLQRTGHPALPPESPEQGAAGTQISRYGSDEVLGNGLTHTKHSAQE